MVTTVEAPVESARALGRVLVVDDEPYVQQILSDALSEAGYQVGVAADGFEAIRRVRELQPDLILLDLMMPAMDGQRFLEIYRQGPGMKVPIIVITAARMAGREVERELGTAVIHKPFDIDRLLELVHHHLEFA